MSKRCCAASCFNSNVNSNKSVEYFGFPKNMEYASAWAKAASREDLLEKSLNSIVKYYLCSEHFTNECFLDPPYNRKLKKTSRPMVVPIPTVFRNNFKECVSKSLKEEISDSQLSQTDDSIDYNTITETTELVDPLLLDDYVAIDHDQSCVGIEQFIQYTDDVTSLVEEDEDDEEEKIHSPEPESNPTICRLCLSNGEHKLLVPIFEDGSEVAYILERILPDMISPDDGFSQQVCLKCLEDATRCLNTIEAFKAAQEKLKR